MGTYYVCHLANITREYPGCNTSTSIDGFIAFPMYIFAVHCQKDNHEQMKWVYRLLSKNNDSNSQWCALVMNVFSTQQDTSHANEDIDTKMTD